LFLVVMLVDVADDDVSTRRELHDESTRRELQPRTDGLPPSEIGNT
jgi:hypothetical protein